MAWWARQKWWGHLHLQTRSRNWRTHLSTGTHSSLSLSPAGGLVNSVTGFGGSLSSTLWVPAATQGQSDLTVSPGQTLMLEDMSTPPVLLPKLLASSQPQPRSVCTPPGDLLASGDGPIVAMASTGRPGSWLQYCQAPAFSLSTCISVSHSANGETEVRRKELTLFQAPELFKVR